MVTRCRDDALLRSLILIGCHIVCNIGCFVHNLSSFFVSLETFPFTFREIFVTAVEDSSVITVLGSGLLEMLYRMKMEESKKQDQSYIANVLVATFVNAAWSKQLSISTLSVERRCPQKKKNIYRVSKKIGDFLYSVKSSIGNDRCVVAKKLLMLVYT